MFYPYVIQDKDGWSFKIKNLNNLENEKKNEDILIYEPFFLDDISLDFSKIPAIYISSNNLKLMNLQKRGPCDFPISMACPYAPIVDTNDDNDENKHENKKIPSDDNDGDNNSHRETPPRKIIKRSQRDRRNVANRTAARNTKKSTPNP